MRRFLPAVKDHRYLWILAITLLAYWPLSLGIFSLKNDNILVFLSFRYNISEAIQAGHLPLWSPYIYLGFPLHADMQSSAWNPIVLLLSLFGRYTLTTLHIETLIYIFLCGAGMYKLLQLFTIKKNIAFALAVCYLTSGFITDVGGNNILFLAGAAFTPFAILYTYRAFTLFTIKDAAKGSIALFFLLTAAYPFFFIATAYVIFAGFVFLLIHAFYVKKKTGHFISLFKTAAVIGILFLVIASPALVSFYQLLDHYQRGSSISLIKSQENSFAVSNIVSFIFPQASTKIPSLDTDIIMRNIYPNIFNLIFLFVLFVKSPKNKIIWFVSSGILFFLLFSFGPETPVRSWSYNFLPLMDKFRHPANARLFVIIGILILSATSLQNFKIIENKNKPVRIVSWIFMLFILLFCTFNINTDALHTLFQNIAALKNGSIRDSLKNLFDNFSYSNFILLGGLIQVGFLAWFIWYSKKDKVHQTSKLVTAIVCNAILFCQLSIPLTFVSKVSPHTINNLIRKYPQGFPIPYLNESIASNSKTDSANAMLIGIEIFYNKKIGFTVENYNPTMFYKIKELLNNEHALKNVINRPFAYLKDATGPGAEGSGYIDSTGNFKITHFDNNSFTFKVSEKKPTVLYLQQSFLPGWKAEIDGTEMPIEKANIAFMSVNVPAGEHSIKFQYAPGYIPICIIVSMLGFIFIFFLLIRKKISV